ncbi:hypothetical protein [Alicyclobacillus macrosporangiidus]|uniref:hypothetical protein n=1 Tax=Alicyclobacillus macrosporangiidus TaxID=392015 RepID=UPI0004972485|nr:hypothetical protein [Alicyclobacillus macrosporangiidus]
MQTLKHVDLTDVERKACEAVGAQRGWNPWILENELVRLKLGERLPRHIQDLVNEVLEYRERG